MNRLIILLITTVFLLSPVLSCQPQGTSSAAKTEATTDSQGVASLSYQDQKLSVVAVDSTSTQKTISNAKVSVTQEQGVNMVYISDPEGKFLPQLTFLDTAGQPSGALTVSLSPAAGKNLEIGKPVQVNINPSSLPKVKTLPYLEVGSYIKQAYPQVRTIVFLLTEAVPDITRSTVSLATSPFKEVLYAHVQKGGSARHFKLVPEVHALVLTTGFIVSVLVGTLLEEVIFTKDTAMVESYKLAERIVTGRKSYLDYMPNLYGLTPEEARRALDKTNFDDVPMEQHDEFITSSTYVTEFQAKNMDGKIVRQIPAANTGFDLTDPENFEAKSKLKITIWVGTESLKPEAKLSTTITKATLQINTMTEWGQQNDSTTLKFYISTTPQVVGVEQTSQTGQWVSKSGYPRYGNLVSPGQPIGEMRVTGGSIQSKAFDITDFAQKHGITTYYVAADNKGPTLAMFYCILQYDKQEQKGIRYPTKDVPAGLYQANLVGPLDILTKHGMSGRCAGTAAEITLPLK